MKTGEVATPVAPAKTTVSTLPANVPDGPVTGAANLTRTDGTGLSEESLT